MWRAESALLPDLVLSESSLPDALPSDTVVVIGGTDGTARFADAALLVLDPFMAWRGDDGDVRGMVKQVPQPATRLAEMSGPAFWSCTALDVTQ